MALQITDLTAEAEIDTSIKESPAAPTPMHTPAPGTEGPGADEEEEEHRSDADV